MLTPMRSATLATLLHLVMAEKLENAMPKINKIQKYHISEQTR